MADKRSGPPSRGGFGGSRGGPSRGGPSRGGPSRGPSRGGAPSRGGFGGGFGGGSRDGGERSSRPSFGDRPPRGDRPFGDRPPRGDRPSFGDRPRGGSGRPAFGGSDRPRGDRPFGDRPPRRDGDRPFGDRPQRSFDDRPKRGFGDRPQRDDRHSDSRGDRGPRRDTDMPFEDRPRRSFQREGFGSSRKRDDMNTERPRGSFGDRPSRPRSDSPNGAPRPERRSYSSNRPERDESFSARPPRRDSFEKRPQRDVFGDEIEGGDDVHSKGPMKGHETMIYGVHAAQAALRNPNRKITAIWVSDIGEGHLEDAYDDTRHPAFETITRRDIERKLPAGAVHQGIALAAEPLDDVFLSDILAAANSPNAERHVVVVLDEVTDPHNVGAILRSMSMFGAKAMIVHKRNAPSITGAMAKIATGAIEHVPMIAVTNLAQVLEELKMTGFTCLGMDEDADYPIEKAPATGHIALVLGNEGEGLRAKTRATCDAIVSIESFGAIKSLNVSNAAAIALYQITRK